MEDKKLTSNNIDEALYYLRQEADRRTVKLWKTKIGQFVELKYLSDEHLLNIIKHLRKKKAEQKFVNEAIASYPYWS